MVSLIDTQEVKIEICAEEALKYSSLVRNLVCTSLFYHSNVVTSSGALCEAEKLKCLDVHTFLSS